MRSDKVAQGGSRWRRLAWFAGLYLLGIAGVGAVALLIRMMLP